MKKGIYWSLGLIVIFLWSFTSKVEDELSNIQDPTIEDIVKSYKKAVTEWPKQNIDKGVQWTEFSSIKSDSTYCTQQEKPNVILGKMLFFDPQLYQSNQISYSTCHDPEMGWQDRRLVTLGNNHLLGNRNTVSLFNIAERKSFFCDGRAKTLEEQASGSLGAHHEMAMNVKTLPKTFRILKGIKSFSKTLSELKK